MQPLQDFLVHMDNNRICKLHSPSKVAAEARRDRKIQFLTDMYLFEQNVKSEISRLSMHVDLTTVNQIVNHIWNNRLTPTQRERFTTLANDANNINQNSARANEDSFIRMIRNDVEQVTSSPFEDALFGGTKKFPGENDIEYLTYGSGIPISDPYRSM
jgi:hypothetical protein